MKVAERVHGSGAPSGHRHARGCKAAMFKTNIWSTFFNPRTITWRMRPTVFTQPKPCSISLRFCCDIAYGRSGYH
jgi:hypothetical protein